MRARLIGLKNNVVCVISRRNFGKPPRCDAHMNELPVPCGPWEPWYTKKQAKYNATLAFGVAWFVLSAVTMFYTGSLYLNWGPPPNPGPPSDYVEVCYDD